MDTQNENANIPRMPEDEHARDSEDVPPPLKRFRPETSTNTQGQVRKKFGDTVKVIKRQPLQPLTPNNGFAKKDEAENNGKQINDCPKILQLSHGFGSPKKLWNEMCKRDRNDYSCECGERRRSMTRSPSLGKCQSEIVYFPASEFRMPHRNKSNMPAKSVPAPHEAPISSTLSETCMGYKRSTSFAADYRGFRLNLIFLLMDECSHFKLQRETFHLAIDYLDRFMNWVYDNDVDFRASYCAAALTCLGTASKVEEVDPPHWIDLAGKSFSVGQLYRMEVQLLTALGWHTCQTTAVQWLGFYLQLISKDTEMRQKCGSIMKAYTDRESLKKRDSRTSRHSAGFLPCKSTSVSINNDSGIGNDSFNSINTTQNATINDSNEDISGFLNLSYANGHLFDIRDFCFPSYTERNFLELVMILDAAVADKNYADFSYRELAAALIFMFYEPFSQIEEITGFTYSYLESTIDFLKPYVYVCFSDVYYGFTFLPIPPKRSKKFNYFTLAQPFDYVNLVKDVELIKTKETKNSR